MTAIARCAALLLALQLGAMLLGSPARSHALEPGYLELREINQSLFAVVWKKPEVGGAPMPIAARLPANCDPRVAGQLNWDGTAYYARWTASCTGGIAGGEVWIEGLERTSTDVLVRIVFADGHSNTERLTPAHPSFLIPS